MKKLLILTTALVSLQASAQTYTQMQWGMNKGVSPYEFGANIGASWSNLGTISPAGQWTLSPSIISMPGTATFNGSIFSVGNGFFANTTQPANAYADMVAPNDTYHDNVLTIENQSKRLGTLWGNAAIRFREPRTGFIGYERAAVGYSAPTSSSYFPHLLYLEGGNIASPGDPYDTDIALINTHVAGATHFPGTMYYAFWMQSSTGIMRMGNPAGGVTNEFDAVNYTTTFYGAPSTGNGIQFISSTVAGNPVNIRATSNSGGNVLMRIDDRLGAGVALSSNNNYAFIAQNASASAVNYITANGSATGGPVGFTATGTDANILMRVEDKGGSGVALTSNGNYSLLAQNASASTVNYMRASGSAAGLPVGFVALGADPSILIRLDDKGGAGAALASNSNYAFVAQNSSASAVNYIKANGSATGAPVGLAATGSDANILMRVEDKGGSGVALTSNSNYALLAQNSSASAVNYVRASGSATGLPVGFVAQGTDPTVLIRVDDKGGAGAALASNSVYALIAQNASASAVNYLSVKGATTGNGVDIASAGSDTNIDLNLTAKGTGTIVAGSPIKLKSYTVATLPTCNAGAQGNFAYVTDATAPTYNGALTGGGAVKVPVFCDGAAWSSH